MHIMAFSQNCYTPLPEEEIIRNGPSYWGLSNAMFDAQRGSQLLNEALEEKLYIEELGFDGIMLNEHHQTPFTMRPVMNVEAAILARITSKVKIVQLGNPLPVADPLRLVEELAMIDLISGGRLVPGFTRGVGTEQLANNINPAYNRERFYEAHDFLVKAWTTPGPWRYEGKHYHYRHVNPWVLPLQKPHPPIWIPSLVSPETVAWAAKKRYPYVALGTSIEATREMVDLYADVAEQEGYQSGPENFGYLQNICVAETEEKAYELARGFVYGGGFGSFGRAEWMFPPGYNSKEATKRLAKVLANPTTGEERVLQFTPGKIDAEKAKRDFERNLKANLEDGFIIAGTPKTVVPKIRHILESVRPGIFSLWYNHGHASYEDRNTCLRLLGEEVVPAMREMAEELDLPSPFEQQPATRPLPATGRRERVVG